MTTSNFPPPPLAEPLFAALATSRSLSDSVEQLHERLIRAEREASITAALLELLAEAESRDRLLASCQLLADRLQSLTGCRQVALAICDRSLGEFSLLVVSEAATLDRHSDTAQQFEAALGEMLLHPGLAHYPPDEPSTAAPRLAQQRLVQQQRADWLLSGPLHNARGKAVAAWLFLGDHASARRHDVETFVRASAPAVAACLDVLRRAERGPVARRLQQLAAKVRDWRATAVLVGLLTAFALSLIPVPYRMNAKCRVEPVLVRSVTVPFDGTLEKSLVKPGDVVDAEQILARMDARELRVELSSLEAERKRAEVKRASSLARHDMGAARMAELDVQRLNLRLQLLNERSEQLEIKSPTAGVVLQGDQRPAEGMPVSVGQPLFEIAPLEEMRVELAIPERDYPHARSGQEVLVRLDACPGQTWRGRLERIHPRAEKWESDHVFVGEFSITGSADRLRPGMNGTATIVGPRSPWIWNVCHKAWEDLLALGGW